MKKTKLENQIRKGIRWVWILTGEANRVSIGDYVKKTQLTSLVMKSEDALYE